MKRKQIIQSILSLLLVFLLTLSLCGSVMAISSDSSGGGGGNGSGGGSGGGSGSGTQTTTDTTTTDVTATPGSGDGTGGGSTEPLTLVTSTPANQATDVPVDSAITLEFSKNVAYATVRDGNLKAVTLWSGAEQVPADVTMADDQLQPDLRDFITVTPSSALKEGTVYTIKVDTSLASKSGDVLLTPTEVSFTTTAPANNSNPTLLLVFGALAVVVVIVVVAVIAKRKKA